MKFIDDMSKRAQRLDIWDIKLAQGAAMCVILIVVKLLPQILTISVWWFVALLMLLAIKPLVSFYFRGPSA